MPLTNPKKILIVLPERLGDAIMTTPAIRYLKHYCPHAEITAICLSSLSQEVLKNNPDIHESILYKNKKLNLSNYIGINLHDDPTNRITREIFKQLNITPFNIPDPDPTIHQADQALLFVQSLLPEHPPITENIKKYFLYPELNDHEFIKKLLPEKTILIGCHIGCHSIAKRGYKIWKKHVHPKVWPIEAVMRFAQKLYNTHPPIKLIITGSKSEKSLGEKLLKHSPHNIINLINQTTVLQLAALMSRLNLFITPDTGVMHAACATEVPLLALFQTKSLIRTGPYRSAKILHTENLWDITADTVYEAAMGGGFNDSISVPK